jgi:hypothetical protein
MRSSDDKSSLKLDSEEFRGSGDMRLYKRVTPTKSDNTEAYPRNSKDSANCDFKDASYITTGERK